LRKKILWTVFFLLAVVVVYAAFRYGTSVRPTTVPVPVGEGGTARVLPQTREVDLYFADSAGRRLSIERREISGENREDLLERIVEELVRGPEDPARMRTLPETTQVRTVYFRDDTVWVDLDSAVRDEAPGGTWTEVLAVYSVVNTLVENFSDIKQVQILIEGSESDTMAGHVDISGPLASRIQLLAGDWE
jgi:spore germination protein GerM